MHCARSASLACTSTRAPTHTHQRHMPPHTLIRQRDAHRHKHTKHKDSRHGNTRTHARTHVLGRGLAGTRSTASTGTLGVLLGYSRGTLGYSKVLNGTRPGAASQVRPALQVPSDFGLRARVLPLRLGHQAGRAGGAAQRARRLSLTLTPIVTGEVGTGLSGSAAKWECG